MIRVLLVDDQAIVRRGLRARLQLEPDIQIAGEAGSGAEALVLARILLPDVVLMDIEMPGVDGITAAATLREAVPDCAVIVLSIHDDAPTRARALAAGAVAFVEKRGTTDALVLAVRRAAGRT